MRLFGVFFFLRETLVGAGLLPPNLILGDYLGIGLGGQERSAFSLGDITGARLIGTGIVDRTRHDGSRQLCAHPPSGPACQVVHRELTFFEQPALGDGGGMVLFFPLGLGALAARGLRSGQFECLLGVGEGTRSLVHTFVANA
jgi:hypothetical protein